MARGVYTVSGKAQTVVAAPQLVFVNVGTTVSLQFLRAWVSQNANATSAQQGVKTLTKASVFPTLVSATPNPTSPVDQASKIVGGTAGAAGTSGINSSVNGAGAELDIYPDNFNVLNGWLWVPTPADLVVLSAAGTQGFGTQFVATPGTLTGWTFGVEYAEV
jgi:hypothetical protein